MKFFCSSGRDPWTTRLDFGGNVDRDTDPGIFNGLLLNLGWGNWGMAQRTIMDHDWYPEIFKGFFIYYCDSYREPAKNKTWQSSAVVCTLVSAVQLSPVYAV